MSPARGPRPEDLENDAFSRDTLLSRTYSTLIHHKEENTPFTRAQSSVKSEMGGGEISREKRRRRRPLL